MSKQLVLAGSYEQYRREFESHLKDTIYLPKLEDVRGRSDTCVHMIGTYYDSHMKEDWNHFYEYCARHNIDILPK